MFVGFFSVRSSRIGMDDHSAKLLLERSIRRDKRSLIFFSEKPKKDFDFFVFRRSSSFHARRNASPSSSKIRSCSTINKKRFAMFQFQMIPFNQQLANEAILNIKAPLLYIGFEIIFHKQKNFTEKLFLVSIKVPSNLNGRFPKSRCIFCKKTIKTSVEKVKKTVLSGNFVFLFQFETLYIDGSHHLHMTHADQVSQRIDEYFRKYFH